MEGRFLLQTVPGPADALSLTTGFSQFLHLQREQTRMAQPLFYLLKSIGLEMRHSQPQVKISTIWLSFKLQTNHTEDEKGKTTSLFTYTWMGKGVWLRILKFGTHLINSFGNIDTLWIIGMQTVQQIRFKCDIIGSKARANLRYWAGMPWHLSTCSFVENLLFPKEHQYKLP